MTAIHLVRVVVPIEIFPVGLPTPLPPMRADLLDQQLVAARQYVDDVAVRLRQQGWTAHPEVVVDSNPAAAVLKYAETHRCDTIALATRGLGGAQRVLFGSVTDKVIHGAAAPVLVVNPVAVATPQRA